MRVHALSQCAFSGSGVGSGAEQCLLIGNVEGGETKRERDKGRENEKTDRTHTIEQGRHGTCKRVRV